MTKPQKLSFAIVAVLAAIAVAGVLRVASYAPAPEAPVDAIDLGFPWRGAVHVHSVASDGAADVDEIMAAAAEAGVDFLVLSDHNPFAASRPEPRWYGDVLLIVAEEISTEDGHLLALEVPPHRYRFGPTARQALADIADEGGWALVAHPDHEWQAWGGTWGGTDGIEVVNLAAAWSRQSSLSRLAAVVASFVDADRAALGLLRPRWPILKTWDGLTRPREASSSVRRRRVAIGAADAHGPFVGPSPSYADTLGVVSTLLWVDTSPAAARRNDDPQRTSAELLAAMRSGRAAVETTALGDARSLRFVAESPSGTVPMGQFADFERGPWRVLVGLEPAAEVELVLLRDGEAVRRTIGTAMEVEIDMPGTYRVEAYRAGVAEEEVGGPPWLVSNPIYIWPAASRLAADIRRAPPLPAPPITRDLLAEARFEANGRGVARNSVSDGLTPEWDLALLPESTPDAFAAMAWRPDEPLDGSGAGGMVIDIRAREPLRINLELRARNDDGATESWVYSIKAGPQSPPQTIPWHRFRTPWSEDLSAARNADPRRPGAGDLTRVEGVFLVVTPLLLQAGSEARLEIRALGLYGER